MDREREDKTMEDHKVDSIYRTGRATDPIRRIVTVQGAGKLAVEHTLSTPITKVNWALKFRHGNRHIPVEQYAFQVDGRTVERFADATALVLKKHHVDLSPLNNWQKYVMRASLIMTGKELLRTINKAPDGTEPTAN